MFKSIRCCNREKSEDESTPILGGSRLAQSGVNGEPSYKCKEGRLSRWRTSEIVTPATITESYESS